MMMPFALEEQAKRLQELFSSAEIEINGTIIPVSLTSAREGSEVRFFIDVPANVVGRITKRIIKNAAGQVCWSDPPGKLNIDKPDTDLRFEIPIQATWKEVAAT
ncbi:hypothetical protein [Brevibacillus sp. HD3.3A]|uniref:hypothetical protein n=1 Tax=Brevibacillus sp. HD3.3A TaxID=2738979 RepID=UPI00156AD6BE|nr:hypothetical protein [Brevibacillus sp. HD3.3A]UED72162.1 hypothetical protein HP435_29085 [Brevibacillus sp. HD3.3A]